MEDRVKTILEKEHSKRFRAMCHRNENLAQEARILLDFYENEEKKRLYAIKLECNDLQKKMIKFSQEKFVNGLLNQLTEIAFQKNDHADAHSVVNQAKSFESSDDSEPDSAPRYLRIETNPFHPSEMSLCATVGTDSSLSVTAEQVTETGPPVPDICDAEKEPEKIAGKDSVVKHVVDRLTGYYDIDKLKFLTQVMLKTLQHNDRSRYEDKVKLVYNLNKYFNESHVQKSPSPKLSSESIAKKGDNTFLFLRPDRQQELRRESEHKIMGEHLKIPKLKSSLHSRIGAEREKSRVSLPNILDAHKTSQQFNIPHYGAPERRHSLPAQPPERRHSQHVTEEHEDDDKIDEMMKIYLKLGHGALLKLPQNTKAMTRSKQRAWLRKDLKNIPITSLNGVQDLRVVMKNCRYLRFPKDMVQQDAGW